MANLIEGLQAEMRRVREEVLPAYESLGAVGSVGKMLISQELADAEAAIASADVVAMVNALHALRDCND